MPAVSIKSSVARNTGGSTPAPLPSRDAIVREGWMYKRGGSHGGRTNWKRRWFILVDDELYYMETRQDTTPRGRILLRGCDFRKADEEVKKACAFGIYSRSSLLETPFYCYTDSAQETEEWLDDLRAAAQGRFHVRRAYVDGRCGLILGFCGLAAHGMTSFPSLGRCHDTWLNSNTPLYGRSNRTRRRATLSPRLLRLCARTSRDSSRRPSCRLQ